MWIKPIPVSYVNQQSGWSDYASNAYFALQTRPMTLIERLSPFSASTSSSANGGDDELVQVPSSSLISRLPV